MASSLSTLGLGSDGVLSYDVIDQLREVDESAQITPIETKISTNTTKSTDLIALTTLAATLKASASTLSDEMTYLTRETSTTGSSATVIAESGSSVQDFYVDVQQLAQADIYQSKSFATEDATFASGDETITITVGSESFDIEVTADTTISELKTLITDASDGSVVPSLLNVGGDTPYKLILKTTETGEDNAISFSSTGDAIADLGLDTNKYQAGTPIGTYSGTDTLVFNVSGTEYEVAVEDGDSVNEINTKIQALGLSELTSDVDADGKLVLTSDDATLSVSGDSVSTFGLDSLSQTSGRVQEATNAKFLYNGVSIERSTNEVTDLIVGVSITLNEEGKTTVDITEDTEAITNSVSSFVSNYNTLISNLEESIKYDSDSGASGTFQGVSQVVSFKSILNRNLMSPDDQGRSLSDYGITQNQSTGYLEFDEEIFAEKIKDVEDIEEFFSGYTDTDSGEKVDGYFTKLNSTLADYIDGDDSILGLYEAQLEAEKTSLQERYDTAVERLDNKYEIMATKWAAYDSIINQLSTEFETLQTLIDSELNSDS